MHESTPEQGQDLKRALLIAEAAIDKGGLEPVLLDLTEQRTYTDYLMLVSARSERQVRAIMDHVLERMQEVGLRAVGVEGRREGRWGLIDLGDVVLHIFQQELRAHYNLESLWVDAPRVPLPTAKAQTVPGDSDEDLGYSLAD